MSRWDRVLGAWDYESPRDEPPDLRIVEENIQVEVEAKVRYSENLEWWSDFKSVEEYFDSLPDKLEEVARQEEYLPAEEVTEHFLEEQQKYSSMEGCDGRILIPTTTNYGWFTERDR